MVKYFLSGFVKQGYQVASGQTPDPRFKQGSIALQKPLFKQLGLDLDACFNGTINVNIKPYAFDIVRPDYTFHHVKWAKAMPAESFSFIQCQLMHRARFYPVLVYFPHPETKPDHFQSKSTIELLSPYIVNMHYNDKVTVIIAQNTISLNKI
ncbi:hypothetical protein [Thalassotalea aquiviva]|uniref:hypothetical protein n=1 Tax=Thalassotalea aquiviva TaxID=3242415 RepID=UPI00352B5EBD